VIYDQIPIVIESQDEAGAVSFSLNTNQLSGFFIEKTGLTDHKIDEVWIQYRSFIDGESTSCMSQTMVPYPNVTHETFTAKCVRDAPFTIVRIWVVDPHLTVADDADVDDCCRPPLDDTFAHPQPPAVQYTFLLHCENTCAETSSAPSEQPSPSPACSTPSVETLSNGVCKNFAVHARTTVTFDGVQTTIHTGDVGVAPGTSITGNVNIIDGIQYTGASNQAFADSVLVAYNAAMAVRDDGQSLDIQIGGKTFTPGTYRSGSEINFALGPPVTLDGQGLPNPVFLFQAGTTLVTAASSYFQLINGAKAENVIWALGSAATLGADSVLEGSILAGTAITFGTKSELNGCALAQSAVTFESEGSTNGTPYIEGWVVIDEGCEPITSEPSSGPTTSPSDNPSSGPTTSHSDMPSSGPTTSHSDMPSSGPTTSHSDMPSSGPTTSLSDMPSSGPTTSLSDMPSSGPTTSSSGKPSSGPTTSLSDKPSSGPTTSPSDKPSSSPTTSSSNKPSSGPTTSSSDKPSSGPTTSPSDKPSSGPTTTTPVVLSIADGVCKNFAVHARTAVTFSAIQTTITGGDVGIAPATGAAITGLVLIVDGVRFPGASTEELDFAALATVAFLEAMVVRSDGNTLVTAPIEGKTFTPGTYRSAATISIAAGGIVTLDGQNQANPVFLFQASSTLGTGAGSKFDLINGAKAENVLWAIGTAATLGANSVIEGSILAGSAITVGAQALINGCVIAQTAITFSSEGFVVMNSS
jgi:hypothetical protein